MAMTDAEKAVLAKYPDAECWSFLFSRYIVFRSRHDGKLAEGNSPDAAWAAAAAVVAEEDADRYFT